MLGCEKRTRERAVVARMDTPMFDFKPLPIPIVNSLLPQKT
jgi:hypothetical protein